MKFDLLIYSFTTLYFCFSIFIESLNTNKQLVIGDLDTSEEVVKLAQVIQDYELIPVATNDSIRFSFSAEKIISTDRFYAVLDRIGSRTIILIDKKNNNYKQLGRYGRGPGEYQNPDDIVYDYENNNFIAYDRSGSKLIFFNSEDGSFIQERIVPFFFTRFEKHGDYYYFLMARSEPKLVRVTDDNFNIVGEYINKDVRDFFKPTNSFHKRNDIITLHRTFSSEMIHFKNGSIISKDEIKFESKNLSEDIFKELEIEDPQAFLEISPNYNTMFFKLSTGNTHIFFEYFYKRNKRVVILDKKNNKTLLHKHAEKIYNDITFDREMPEILGYDYTNNTFLGITYLTDESRKGLENNLDLPDNSVAIILEIKL